MGPEKRDSVLNGIIRHVLTAAGGALTTKGYVDAGELELLVGAAITIIGSASSSKTRRITPRLTLSDTQGNPD